jgi:regulator of RNase E activity RraA
VYARYFEAAGAQWLGAEWNVPIRIDNVTVLPGDIIIAEDEGILVFPPDIVETVLQKANELKKIGDYERKLILEKKYRFRDVYPPAPELMKEFEQTNKKTP